MRRGLLVNLGLATGVSVVFLTALEGLARLVAPAPPAPRQVAEYIWDWDHMMPGGFYVMRSSAVGWPPWEEFNVDGLRDRTWPREKPEGTWRVAVLGDSVTLGAGLKPTESYPRVLGEKLRREGRRLEVMSVALWGWSTRQERIAWHRIARSYDPDQAILAVCLNDIPELHNNLARPPRWITWLHERSALVRLLVRAEGREIEDVERLFASVDSPRVREALERFFEEVRTLRREVENDGARFAVIVFPFRFQLEAGAPPPAVQERIAAFCRAEKIACFDFLPTLGRMGPETFFDYDHLSVAGATLTADTLLASDLLPGGFSNAAVLREYFETGTGRGAAEVKDWLGERSHRPGDAGVKALGEALLAENAEVRMAAAWALDTVGPGAASEIGRLTHAVREDPSTGVRVGAAGALGAIGTSGGRAVTRDTAPDLDEDDAPSRAGRRGEDRPASGDTKRRTASGDDRPQEPALAGLLDRGAAAPAPKDAEQAEGERPAGAGFRSSGARGPATKRTESSRALEGRLDRRRRDEVAGALFDALGDASEAVRHAAADALFAVGTEEADLSRLVGALGRDDAYVRGFAAWSLGNLGAAAGPAVPALVAAFDRPDTEATVVFALARIGPAAAPAVPALVEVLHGEDADRRWRAARTLGRIGGAARVATPDLIAALRDPDGGVRRHAARALGRVASAEGPAPAALQRATGDRDREVRNEARRALERLSGKPAARPRGDR